MIELGLSLRNRVRVEVDRVRVRVEAYTGRVRVEAMRIG